MDKAFLNFPTTRKMERKQQRIRSSMSDKVRNAPCICSLLPFLYQKSPGDGGFDFSLTLGQYVPEQISQHTGSWLILWATPYVVTWIRPHSITCFIKFPVEDGFKPFSEDESHCVTEIRFQFSILSDFFHCIYSGRKCRRTAKKKEEETALPSEQFLNSFPWRGSSL